MSDSKASSGQKEPSHRGLKILVGSMGLLLIGGTILLFVLVGARIKDRMEGKPGASGRGCAEQEVNITQYGANMQNIVFDDRTIDLLVHQPDGNVRALRIHRCSGEILSNVLFK